MKNIIDLHTHTTKSDGELTPNELLNEAEKIGLKYLSITDHESVEAYYEINPSCFSGILIPGIELRTSCCGIAIELLAYGFDVDKMREILKRYNYKDTNEIDKYMIREAFKQYKKRNIKISDTFIEDYDSKKFSRLSAYIRYSIEQYDENKCLIDGLAKDASFFRHCMTNPKSSLFIDLTDIFPSVSDLISSIKKANGFISIPHVYSYREYSEKILRTLLENYKEIDAIEAYHSSYSNEQMKYLFEISKKYGKYITGGSDFHGAVRPSVKLGKGENNLEIPEVEVKKWLPCLTNIINT